MRNKVILITGSTDGIGRQTAVELAALGATVLVHGRNPARGKTVVEEIQTSTGNKKVDLFIADLASLKQVRELAAEVQRRYDRLDVLLNNAGVFMNERKLTEDGFEMTYAVNHLAPFLLTNLLLGLLKKTTPSRIVTVSSVAHTRGRLDFENLQAEKTFGGYYAYALSKLANVLFAYQLARQLEGTGVTSNCLHPGVIGTKLLRSGFNMPGASTADGAETLIHLASSPDVEHVTGKYFQNKISISSSPVTYDETLQRELWKVSQKQTGLPE
jgi:NAD(P)-dependent dehydrogenase (short-subunit alcohol dehydrogenase family)